MSQVHEIVVLGRVCQACPFNVGYVRDGGIHKQLLFWVYVMVNDMVNMGGYVT